MGDGLIAGREILTWDVCACVRACVGYLRCHRTGGSIFGRGFYRVSCACWRGHAWAALFGLGAGTSTWARGGYWAGGADVDDGELGGQEGGANINELRRWAARWRSCQACARSEIADRGPSRRFPLSSNPLPSPPSTCPLSSAPAALFAALACDQPVVCRGLCTHSVGDPARGGTPGAARVAECADLDLARSCDR